MNNGDAIYYIKQLAVLSTGKEMPKIEEALETAIKALSEDYAKGYQSGYKAKEYDLASDCDGCKYSEGIYFRARCEGCCRNYADGYVSMVAEQTEPSVFGNITSKCQNCKNSGSYKCLKCDGEMYYKQTEPSTDCGWK